MNQKPHDDNLVPWDDGRIADEGDITVITEADTTPGAGPYDEHRKRLEKKYGRPKPPTDAKPTKDGEPPSPA